jgi:hypothetical protein
MVLLFFTVVTVKSTIIWDVTSCNPVESHRRLGGTFCFHLHCRRVSQCWSHACLTLGAEDGGSWFLQNSVGFYRHYILQDSVVFNK